MARLIPGVCTVGVLAVVLAGCSPTPGATRAPSLPPTVTASAVPSEGLAVPDHARGEVLRLVYPGTTAVEQLVNVGGGPYVVSVACLGGGDLQLSYTVKVDGRGEGGGAVPCSSDKHFANSVLVGVPAGTHRVSLAFDASVSKTRAAFAIIVPASSLP